MLNYLPALLEGPVAQESVVDSALLRSNFRPFKTAFLYTSCTQIFGVDPRSPWLSGDRLPLGAGRPESKSRRPDQNITYLRQFTKICFTQNLTVEFFQTGRTLTVA